MESLWFSCNESNLTLRCGQLFSSWAAAYQVLPRPIWVCLPSRFFSGHDHQTDEDVWEIRGWSRSQKALQLKRRQSRGEAKYIFLRNWSLVSMLGRSAIWLKYGNLYSISYGDNPVSLWRAVLILRRAIVRHLVQGSLVPRKFNYLFACLHLYVHIYLLASLSFSKLLHFQLSNFCNLLEISGQLLVTKCNFNISWPRGSSKFNPEYFLIWSFNLLRSSTSPSSFPWWMSKALVIFWDLETDSLIPFIIRFLCSGLLSHF